MPATLMPPPATNDPTRTCRVLLVDDHELLREGLKSMIANEPDMTVCGEIDDLPGAMALVRELNPDVAVIDIALKSGNGLDLVKQIRSAGLPVQMIVSSMYTEQLYGERALRAGAVGYVCKQAPSRTVLDAVRRVLSGKLYFSPELTQGVLHQVRDRGDTALRSPIEALSDRELEVFRRLGQGLTSLQIAEQLHLSRSTIDTYRERLKTKLGLANAAELLRQAALWESQNR